MNRKPSRGFTDELIVIGFVVLVILCSGTPDVLDAIVGNLMSHCYVMPIPKTTVDSKQ